MGKSDEYVFQLSKQKLLKKRCLVHELSKRGCICIGFIEKNHRKIQKKINY